MWSDHRLIGKELETQIFKFEAGLASVFKLVNIWQQVCSF